MSSSNSTVSSDQNRLARTPLDDEVSRIRASIRAGSSWLVESHDTEFSHGRDGHGKHVLYNLVCDSRRLLAALGRQP